MPPPPLPERDLVLLAQERDRLSKLRDTVRKTACDLDLRERLDPMASLIQDDSQEIEAEIEHRTKLPQSN